MSAFIGTVAVDQEIIVQKLVYVIVKCISWHFCWRLHF